MVGTRASVGALTDGGPPGRPGAAFFDTACEGAPTRTGCATEERETAAGAATRETFFDGGSSAAGDSVHSMRRAVLLAAPSVRPEYPDAARIETTRETARTDAPRTTGKRSVVRAGTSTRCTTAIGPVVQSAPSDRDDTGGLVGWTTTLGVGLVMRSPALDGAGTVITQTDRSEAGSVGMFSAAVDDR